MDPKELRGLYEAYSEVYAPQQIDEIFGLGGRSAKDRLANSDYMKKKNKEADEKAIQNLRDMMSKDPERQKRPSRINNEELDIFDVVLEFLQAEGYAETLEEAEWMMANKLNAEDINAIVEAMHGEEDEEEMKKGKKSKKSEEEDEEDDEEEELEEASYSAKAARAGKDIGKPGKAFAKIAKSAAKRYGSKERGEKVAGAVLAKLRAKRG